jgi:hypothetical protein
MKDNFYVIKSLRKEPEFIIALNIDNDPEALYYYNYKTFSTVESALKVSNKFQELSENGQEITYAYWDFGL